jgi:uncharacterized protein
MIRTAAAVLVAAALAGVAFTRHDDPRDPQRGREQAYLLLSGAALGALLQRSRFCFASAFRDLFLLRDRRVALGVLAALAAGSIGYAVVLVARNPDPAYLPRTAHIAPAGVHLLLGGAAFGVGMVLAGGCVSGSLYRLGEGSLVAPVTLAGMVVGFWGGFASWNALYSNVLATPASPVVWFPRVLGYGGAVLLQLAALGALALWILRTCPAPPPRPSEAVTPPVAFRKVFRDGWPAPLAGAAIGVLATFSFLRVSPLGVTAQLGLVSRKLGRTLGIVPERLEGLDQMAGCRPVLESGWGNDNGLFILALVAGSLVASLLSNEFRIRVGRPRTWALALAGGVLLGFGSMISLGCTVGTLLSGIMAFSMSGWLFGAGLLGGAWLGGRLLRKLA